MNKFFEDIKSYYLSQGKTLDHLIMESYSHAHQNKEPSYESKENTTQNWVQNINRNGCFWGFYRWNGNSIDYKK